MATQAAGVVFGAFWGGVVVAISTVPMQALRRVPPERAIFNVFQRTASVAMAVLAYQALGGEVPPTYLVSSADIRFAVILQNVLAFLGGAVVYVLINGFAVSGALAISQGKNLYSVWKINTFWKFGYDIPFSLLALFVAALYMLSNREHGASRLWFAGAFGLAIFLRFVQTRLAVLRGLYDQLDRAHAKLELNFREQLLMMVKSIEARDPYTSGHSQRVAMLSRGIALELGAQGIELEDIETAALLHDVGKIHAEFAPLLQKEGRLTQEEWELMKTHAARGADLVQMFSRFRGEIERCVRYHHERWDGKGYPEGLVSESIPLGARIIMISDTIDAMTTDRPYRKALPFEAVISELRKYRGAQFDPHLVDVVVSSVSIRSLVADPSFSTKYQPGKAFVPSVAIPARSEGGFGETILASRDLGQA